MAAAGASQEQIIQGVANILQEASAALVQLAQLGALTPPAPEGIVPPLAAQGTVGDAESTLANAAQSLAQVAAAFRPGAAGFAAAAAAGAGASPVGDTAAPSRPSRSSTKETVESPFEETPLLSSTEFVLQNNLDVWVGEVLDMLSAEQLAKVVNPPMNVGNVRNPNGIVMSRLRPVVPLEQRLQIFININSLAAAVVDRLSTLSDDQCEAVLEAGVKIQRASNPSGVAMRRISDVLRDSRFTGGSTFRRSDRSRSRKPTGRDSLGRERGEMPLDLQGFVDTLGLDWWCSEVLKHLSLFQRQQIVKDLGNMGGVRNPSGVIMSRVKQVVAVTELLSIFIDLNSLDESVQARLQSLDEDQQAAVIAPGIYLQNVRNPSVAVQSRINNVLQGSDAMGKPSRRQDLSRF